MIGTDSSFRMNDDFMMALAQVTNNGKEISVVYWFIKSMNKFNQVDNVIVKDLYERAGLSKASMYKLMKRLEDIGLIYKIKKGYYMVNPEMIVNINKSELKAKYEIIGLWNMFTAEDENIEENNNKILEDEIF